MNCTMCRVCRWRFFASLMVLIVAWSAPPAWAQSDAALTYDRVQLIAKARRDVANDEMIVIMAAEKSGLAPAELAAGINTDMQWALGVAEAADGVDVQTRNYQSYPRYDNGRVVGWQASQELALRSRDNVALTELVGELQSRLLVRSMNFRVTPTARQAAEDALIGEALQAFERRAALVGEHLQDRAYRIVEMTIDTGDAPVFRQPVARAMRAQAADMIEAPATAAGTSEIVVTVSGTVEFQLP